MVKRWALGWGRLKGPYLVMRLVDEMVEDLDLVLECW